MKYAFMSFSTPQLSFDQMLSLAQALGYDAIEPRAGSNHAHGIELEAGPTQRAEFKAKAADSGITLCCLAVSCRYADPATVQDQVAQTRQYIDLAADIGAARLRVFGGKLADGLSREAATEQVAQALASVADQAAERGVIVCMETHDDWCDPNHVVGVIKQVDHPAVAVNWDVMHPVRRAGMSMDQAFEILRPYIKYVHFHDGGPGDGQIVYLPMGEGVYDHKRVLALLQADGYDGYLSGEWIGWEPHEVHLPRELARMKQYEAELAA